MDETKEPSLTNQHQHPEEEEHHENGTSKMFRKVKARAKKFKNSLTKHDHKDHHEEVVKEEDDDDETEEPQVIKHVEDNSSNGQETKTKDKEETRDAPKTYHPLSDREVPLFSRTDKNEYLAGQRKVNVETPNKLEEDVSKEGSGEARVPIKVVDEKSGQGFERDLSAKSKEFDKDFESVLVGKDSSPVRFEGDTKARNQDFDMNTEFKNSPSRSKEFKEFDKDFESVLVGKDSSSPVRFKGDTESRIQEFGKKSPSRSKEFKEFDMKTEPGSEKNSPISVGGESEADQGNGIPKEIREFDKTIDSKKNEYSPVRRQELDLKNESDFLAEGRPGYGEQEVASPGGEGGGGGLKDDLSGVSNYQSNEGNGEAGVPKIVESLDRMKVTDDESPEKSRSGIERDLSTRSKQFREFDRDFESVVVGKDSQTRSEGDSKARTWIDKTSPSRSKEFKEFDKDFESVAEGRPDKDEESDFLAEGRPDYGEQSEEKNIPERDDFTETRDSFGEEETKPSVYADEFATATLALKNQAIAEKDEVTSKLGYTEEECPVSDETQVVTPVNEKNRETTESTTKLPLSGGGSGVEETLQAQDKEEQEDDEKSSPKDIAEKLRIGKGEEKKETTIKHDETDEEEVKGEGMVGMIKGWFGGGGETEEVKPKSPHSIEESPQARSLLGGGGATKEEVKPKSTNYDEKSSQSLGTTVGKTHTSLLIMT
ncbi:unnamed protein product [Cochlearia groenlandica]